MFRMMWIFHYIDLCLRIGTVTILYLNELVLENVRT